jgi:hypothetical protein
MTIFGTIKTRTDLEAAAKLTLQTWFSTYLAEVERQHDVVAGSYERPHSYTTTNDFEKFDEDQLPAIIIVSPGMTAAPVKQGNGQYRTTWSLGVGVVCSGNDENDVRTMVDIYTAAIRTLLVQRPSLGQFAAALNYEDERYDEGVSTAKRRSLQAGYVLCSVEVDGVVDASGGPITPSDPPTPATDPIPDWPIATSGSVTVQKVKEIS